MAFVFTENASSGSRAVFGTPPPPSPAPPPSESPTTIETKYDNELRVLKKQKRDLTRQIVTMEKEKKEKMVLQYCKNRSDLHQLEPLIHDCYICHAGLLEGAESPEWGVLAYKCGCTVVQHVHARCFTDMKRANNGVRPVCGFCSHVMIVP